MTEVTQAQRRSLLAVACPWCGAGVGEVCAVLTGHGQEAQRKRRRDRTPVRTLGGGCHDARWQAALGVAAPVVTAVVDSIPRRTHPRTPVPAGRPW